MSLVTNNSEQPRVWVDGQYLPATKASNGEWFVEIDGKKVKVDKNDLFGINSNLTEHPQKLVNYYDDLIAKNEEKIDYLKATGEAIKSQMKGVKEQFDDLLNKFGVKKYSDIDDKSQQAEAKKFYADLSSLRSAKTANFNREYSAYMTAFDYTLAKGNWQNQLALAEHVQNSIFG